MPQLSRSQLLMYVAIAAAVVLTGARALRSSGGASGGLSPPPTTSAAASVAAPAGAVSVTRSDGGPSVVQVAGAVRRPGVYRLPAGSRVQDAVRRAGGRAHGGDVDAVNLAAKVADGQRIVVPKRVSAAGGAAAVASAPAPAPGSTDPPADTAPIDLNTATAEQLDTLDGVGPATVAKILEFRTQHGGFTSVDDLAQIPGIGEKRLAALKPKVVV